MRAFSRPGAGAPPLPDMHLKPSITLRVSKVTEELHRLRELHRTVVPLNHLAEGVGEGGPEDLPHDCEVPAELPPRIHSVLVLNLNNGDPPRWKVNEEGVGLAPLEAAHSAIKVLKPRASNITIPKEISEMGVEIPLIPNPLPPPATTPRRIPGE